MATQSGDHRLVTAAQTRLDHPGHRSGSPQFARLQTAMLGAALAAFALLYCSQPLLPALSDRFGVSAAAASLTVSASTGCLALAILPLSSLAEAFGRVRLMRLGLTAACALVLLSAAAPSFWMLVVLRGLVGVALAAVVAVAMGHVGDEVHPTSLGTAMGVYVAGNTLGGVGGRLVAAGIGGGDSWRHGVLAVSVLGLIASFAFSIRVPEPVRFRPVPLRWQSLTSGVGGHLRDAGIVRLCVIAFLLMGGFVATYNYLTYRLLGGPFQLSQRMIGLIFLAYLAGTASSTVAGRLADRYGPKATVLLRTTVMLGGLILTLPNQLLLVIAGLLVFTAGFFGAHAAASAWVSQRACIARAQASALYLCAYYAGSSVLGAATGIAYGSGRWAISVAVVAGYIVLAAAVALGVRSDTADSVSAAR
jgi:YNFM family putative membrane transporter